MHRVRHVPIDSIPTHVPIYSNPVHVSSYVCSNFQNLLPAKTPATGRCYKISNQNQTAPMLSHAQPWVDMMALLEEKETKQKEETKRHKMRMAEINEEYHDDIKKLRTLIKLQDDCSAEFDFCDKCCEINVYANEHRRGGGERICDKCGSRGVKV